MIPSTVQQAESQNWRKSKVDQICDDDKDMPGFRYENLNEPSKFEMNTRPLAMADDYPYDQEENTRNAALQFHNMK